jgi:CheY-like chemotaxis protein
VSESSTIVIADDATDVRVLLRTMLEAEGFTVVGEAGNGEEALSVVEKHQPDLLVLDLSMPVMDGLQAIPEIRERSPNTRILVLSGFVSPEVKAEVLGAGADACIEKGLRVGGIVDQLRDLIA